jgi:hypothetical protein
VKGLSMTYLSEKFMKWFIGLRQPWLWSIISAGMLIVFSVSSRWVCTERISYSAVWWGKATVIGLLFVSLVSLLLTTLWFVFTEVVIIDDKEKCEKFVSRWPEDKLHRSILALIESYKASAVEHSDALLSQFLERSMIAREVSRRMGVFFLLALIHLTTFTAATFSIITWTYGGLHGLPTASLTYPYLNVGPDVAGNGSQLLEASIYLNLITISTTGFGDMAPTPSLCARILVDAEVLSSMFLFVFGLNMLASILVENSYQSWVSRRKLLRKHLRRALAQAWLSVQ